MRNIITTILLIAFLIFLGLGGVLLIENANSTPVVPLTIFIIAFVCIFIFFSGRYLFLKYDPSSRPR